MNDSRPQNFPKPGWMEGFDEKEAKKALPEFDDLVVHPRYGRGPDVLRGSIKEQVQFGLYQNEPAWLFPTTRIAADPSKQNFSVVPHQFYVDVLKRCGECDRWYVFFAKEQQYWFEELRFFTDSRSLHCPACRKLRRHHQRQVQDYSRLASLDEYTLDEVQQFLRLTIDLWNQRYLTRATQLDRAISIAVRYSFVDASLDTVRELRRSLSSNRDGRVPAA